MAAPIAPKRSNEKLKSSQQTPFRPPNELYITVTTLAIKGFNGMKPNITPPILMAAKETVAIMTTLRKPPSTML